MSKFFQNMFCTEFLITFAHLILAALVKATPPVVDLRILFNEQWFWYMSNDLCSRGFNYRSVLTTRYFVSSSLKYCLYSYVQHYNFLFTRKLPLFSAKLNNLQQQRAKTYKRKDCFFFQNLLQFPSTDIIDNIALKTSLSAFSFDWEQSRVCSTAQCSSYFLIMSYFSFALRKLWLKFMITANSAIK